MSVEEIEPVVKVWTEEYRALGALEEIRWVQIFENRGAMMGASNPHPHCQIWATESLPNEAVKELASQRAYREERGGCLLCDYLALELDAKARIVCENEGFVALTPFWAVWPFETLVLPRRHFGAMDEMSGAEARGLADILRQADDPLRQSVRDLFPLFDGLPPVADRRRRASRVAFPRPLLSAAAEVRFGAQVHGRIRAARRAAARHHARERGGAPARRARRPLSRSLDLDRQANGFNA